MDVGVDVVKPQQVSLYPVSMEWRPPFTMLVPLKVRNKIDMRAVVCARLLKFLSGRMEAL